ncbi:hypothetical protein [Pseudomonas sp. MWU13-2105]|uniref:hypothetical protein n=1 Tax=Pseudomonas sp. MWU13-2105 TaxID=2935074 RepID=UPI00200E7453|nr:hypothetical protein [Pseudomonas sp. MWU13-2105]
MKIFQRGVLLIKVLVLLMVGASSAWASNAVSDHGAVSPSKSAVHALYADDTDKKADPGQDDQSDDSGEDGDSDS